MDTRDEIRDFLSSRRAEVTPDQAGLPVSGGTNRRVPGLRREEVAMLAGVSSGYYVRLERGNLAGVSEKVLDSVATALHLDDAERAHLCDLARAAATRPIRSRRRTPTPTVPVSVQAMLDAMTGAPAVVRSERLDILAVNALGRALYGELSTDPNRPANHARFTFLDPRAQDFWADWGCAADDTVGNLRLLAVRQPNDRNLHDLVGELSTRSEEFRRRWARHNLQPHRGGSRTINHPVVGRLDLMFDTLTIAQAPSLTVVACTAVSGTPTADALQLLASWAATQQQSSTPSPNRMPAGRTSSQETK